MTTPELTKPATTLPIPTTPTPTRTQSTPTPPKSAFNVAARARASLATASSAVSSLRGQAARAATHPAVGKASTVATGQVAALRDALGRSETVRAVEGAAGVDRVWLVLGGVVLFTALIPFNAFGLAAAASTAVCFAWPSVRALTVLEGAQNPADMRNLLSYFVVLGYLQVVEAVFGGAIVKAFPRYHLAKIAIMFYLGHYKGASQLYDIVLRRLVLDTAPARPSAEAKLPSAASGSPLSEGSSYSDMSDVAFATPAEREAREAQESRERDPRNGVLGRGRPDYGLYSTPAATPANSRVPSARTRPVA